MGKKNPENVKNYLSMPEVTKKKKTERGRYLRKRLDELFNSIDEWIDGTEFFLKRDNVLIDEIKIPAVDIRTEEKKVAALKTAGLWGFGVNVQVNIIADKETNFIYDTADESSKANWELIYGSGKSPKKLTKVIFRNLLRRLNK